MVESNTDLRVSVLDWFWNRPTFAPKHQHTNQFDGLYKPFNRRVAVDRNEELPLYDPYIPTTQKRTIKIDNSDLDFGNEYDYEYRNSNIYPERDFNQYVNYDDFNENENYESISGLKTNLRVPIDNPNDEWRSINNELNLNSRIESNERAGRNQFPSFVQKIPTNNYTNDAFPSVFDQQPTTTNQGFTGGFQQPQQTNNKQQGLMGAFQPQQPRFGGFN
ncbi:Uncharacterized protein QTN25_000441 [Entamoeba marina]